MIDVIGFYIYQLNAKYIIKIFFDKELNSFLLFARFKKISHLCNVQLLMQAMSIRHFLPEWPFLWLLGKKV